MTSTDVLTPLLENEKVTDICLNGPNEIFVDEGSGLEKWIPAFPPFEHESDYRKFVLEQISLSGKTWDAKLPFLDTVFFQTHRAHIAFPPLAQHGIYVSLRRLPTRTPRSLLELQTQAKLRWKESSSPFETLIQSVTLQESMIFCGGTGSGKTTLLNDLLSFASEQDRIIALEDTAEIHPQHPHFLSLLSRTSNADGFGQVTLRDLLRQTLRMRPDRILIGECRGDEILDLLQALNTGHRGTLCTLHANSARDALRRMELMALLAAKGTIPDRLIKELIAHGIQKLVFLEKRKIKTVLHLEGMERDTILSRPIFNEVAVSSHKSHL